MRTTTEISVRPATLEDLPSLIKLDEKLFFYDSRFDDTLDLSWSATDEAQTFFEECLASENSVALVAESEGRIVSFLSGCLTEPLSYRIPMVIAEVDSLFVEEGFRNRQLGAAMITAFKQWAREKKAQRIRVEVSAGNKQAISFYERSGFLEYNTVMEGPLD